MKRIFALLLAVVMMVGMYPATAIHVHATEAEELPVVETTPEEAVPVEEETTEPVTTEPVTETTDPVEETTAPATEATEPVTETTEPVTEETEPVTDATEPVSEPTVPETEVTEPVTVPDIDELLVNDPVKFSAANSSEYLASDSSGRWTLDHAGTFTLNYNFGDYSANSPAPWEQYSSEIKKIIVSSSVSAIGDYAFISCAELTEVVILDGSNLTIGESAFSSCPKLKTVENHRVVKKVENEAFAYCTSLESIGFPGSPYGFEICEKAFYYCNKLKTISIPAELTIGANAFQKCEALDTIYINSYKATNAFSANSTAFTDVTATVYYPPNSYNYSKWGQSYGGTLTWVCVNQGTCGVNAQWSYDPNAKHLTISGTGTIYGTYDSGSRFPWGGINGEILKITVASGIKEIPDYTFEYCETAETIELPETITYLSLHAFQDCGSLNNLLLPSSLKAIDGTSNTLKPSFIRCESLTDLYYFGTSEEWAAVTNATRVTSSDSEMTIHFLQLNSGEATCTKPGTQPYYQFDDTSVYDDMYDMDRKPITELATVPASGHNYENGVCTGCGEKQAIASGTCGTNAKWSLSAEGVLTISGTGAMADYETASDAPWYADRGTITAVVIGDGVTTIGDRAFYNCAVLTDVTIGASLTTVGTYAFRGDAVLADVTIPASVTELKDSAFRACTALATVTFEGNAPAMGNYVFNDGAANLNIQYYENKTGFDVAPWTDYALSAQHIGQWVIDSEPACTTDGSRHVDCSYCNTTITETIPGGHKYEDGVCSVCQNVEILASGTCGTNVTWKLDGTGKLTISGSGAMEINSSVSVPWYDFRSSITIVEIEDGITGIGNYAFYYCTSLTSVTIPDSVTSIGHSAFYHCECLSSISIPAGVLIIGSDTFNNCSNLSSIRIPNSVISIGEMAFFNCDGLTGITIPESVSSIGIRAFESCDGLTHITIPESVTSLGGSAFRYCENLISITIIGNVTSIGSFEGCSNLTSITIPDSVTSIGDYAFRFCCKLTSINIPENVISIGNSAFYGCDSLANIIIPKNVTSIGNSAFYDCDSLTSIIIPKSVTNIGDNAFRDCYDLSSVTIQGNITSISDSAFYFCASLSSITIPESVIEIGVDSFYCCNSLTNIYYGGSPQKWSNLSNRPTAKYIHYSCTNPEGHWNSKQVDATCTEAGYTAETCVCGYERNKVETDGAKSHDFGNWTQTKAPTCTEKGSERRNCANCDHYETREVVANGHSMGEWTQTKAPTCTEKGSERRNCANCDHYETRETESKGHNYENGVCTVCGEKQVIASGTCGTDVTWVLDGTGTLTISGTGAMKDYPYYSSVPWSLNRRSINTIIIETGVTYIGSYAFHYCNSLTNVTIPESITIIGDCAFYECSSLTSVTIPKGVTRIGDSAFRDCSSLTNVTIPKGVTSIGPSAFYCCSSLASVTIPESVTGIGDCAFYGCSSLASVTIPESVTSVDEFAFYGCSSLASVTIPESVTSIGCGAFDGGGLMDVYYGGTSAEWSSLSNRPSVGRVHYNCTTSIDHWVNKNVEGSCETDGYTYEHCACGYERNKVITTPAPGHNYVNDICTICGTMDGIDGGNCGANAKWSLSAEGVLTIYGSGAMADYAYGSALPWYNYHNSIIKIVIKEGVTSISDYAFYECSNLVSITIGEDVKTIGKLAFANCTGLTSMNLPEGVVSIGDSAFYECTGLTDITIPRSLTDFGAHAFYGCSNLTNVYITDMTAWLTAFTDGGNTPMNLNGQDKKLYLNGNLVTDLVIPNGITAIPSYAFADCTSLKSVAIPESVTDIGMFAFYSCVGLTELTIPDSVTNVDEYAFSICDGLETVTISKNLTEIEEGVFAHCEGLKQVTIPDGVQSIGERSFTCCTNLVSVTIPASVTSIGLRAFSFDNNIWHVLFKGTEAQWKAIAVGDSNEELTQAKIHCNAVGNEVTASDVLTCKGKALWHCTICNEYLYDKDPTVEAAGHSFGEWAENIPPTCTEKGSERRDCVNCDHYETREVNAKGHSMGEWTETKAPTCTQKGSERRDCANCDHFETREVKAKNHNYKKAVIAPTYTKQGYTEYTCSNCGDSYKESYVDALGLPVPKVTVEANPKTGGTILTWKAQSLIAGVADEAYRYEVQYATSSKGTYKVVAGTKNLKDCRVAVNVPIGKTYYFKVKAVAKEAAYSSSFSASVKVVGKCAQPVVTVVANETSGKPVLTWNKVTSAKKYTVYSVGTGGKLTSLGTTTKTTFTHSKATVGTQYTYVVKANASSSTYNSANSVSVTCLAICAKPVVTLSVDSTSGKPIISWKTVSGAAKYDVYRSTTETGTYTKLTSQSGLKYTDTTAAPDTAYWYKVVARGTKAACDSRDSVAKQIRSSLAKPVVTFTTDGTSGKPVLKWTAVDGATGYEVHRSSSATKSYKAVAKLGAGETSYQDASVSAGKGYYYKVVAIGKNTKSAFSSYKKLSAKCAQPVITAKADSTSGKPIISWSKVTGAKKYTVYSVSASGALTSLGTTTKTTFTHTKATVGTKYTYVVKANASKSTYNSANSASVTCTAICAQPVATVKLDAATGKPVVSWKAVSGAVSYEVYRSENGGQFAKISAGNVTSYTDTKAVADRQYTYKVKAIGKSTALNSEVGNVVSITATCAAPKITGSLNGTKPMISWASVEGATGYTVYRSTKSGSGYKAIAKGVTASSYTDNSAKKGKTYYYKVVAQSQNTTSAMSNYVKIKSK